MKKPVPTIIILIIIVGTGHKLPPHIICTCMGAAMWHLLMSPGILLMESHYVAPADELLYVWPLLMSPGFLLMKSHYVAPADELLYGPMLMNPGFLLMKSCYMASC